MLRIVKFLVNGRFHVINIIAFGGLFTGKVAFCSFVMYSRRIKENDNGYNN